MIRNTSAVVAEPAGKSTRPGWLAPMSGFRNSWLRCSNHHRLDPAAKPQIHRLSARELRDETLPHERHRDSIAAELNFVQSVLEGDAYCSSFANNNGVILDFRESGSANSHIFRHERAGVIWSESVAGTNGAGTCLEEKRPLIVIRDEHFFEAFSDLSCFSFPVFAETDRMIGAFNIAAVARQFSNDALAVISGLAQRTAERLGNTIFAEAWHDYTILRLLENGRTLLLAVDSDHRILAMNRAASQELPVPQDGDGTLWSLFERSEAALRGFDSNEDHLFLCRRGRSGQSDISLLRPMLLQSIRDRAPVAKEVPAQLPSESPQPAAIPYGFGPLVHEPGRLRQLRRAVANGLPILLLGETGTGKDTMARAIHADSDRAKGPFVAVNCGAIPEALIDSELFGYAAGAFTGARREGQSGRIREAEGGTLFLDEIGDMPLQLQARLLRFLETGEVSPLGAGKVQNLSVRVIAATNLDLTERLAAGRFRADLYFRLAGLVIEMPALRERCDFDSIVERLLIEVGEKAGGALSLSDAARALLRGHDWPGNVREMKFVIHRAACICEDGIITEADISLLSVPRPG